MFDIARRRPLVSLAVAAGLLVAAVPAGAHEAVSPGGPQGDPSSTRAHTPGRHASDRQELTRRITCAIANGGLDDRRVKVIARALEAGNERVVGAIAAADPEVCMAARHVAGSGIGRGSELSSHTRPSADGIIAVLIGL